MKNNEVVGKIEIVKRLMFDGKTKEEERLGFAIREYKDAMAEFRETFKEAIEENEKAVKKLKVAMYDLIYYTEHL